MQRKELDLIIVAYYYGSCTEYVCRYDLILTKVNRFV